MTADKTVLVMAGAREAHEIAVGLMKDNQNTIVYLPEPERMFDPFPVPTRVGGLHRQTDFQTWVEDQNVGVIIDASHAFDTALSDVSHSVAAALSLPYLRVLRPPWQAQKADDWHQVTSVSEAARSCPDASIAFSNTGWPSIDDYADFTGHSLYLRQTHRPRTASPYEFMHLIEGSPPFSIAEEVALFKQLNVTHLICRNTGGQASQSKLLAARDLGLPVFMISRPPLDKTIPVVETAAAALEWKAGL